mgnify:CR=1 FL=1
MSQDSAESDVLVSLGRAVAAARHAAGLTQKEFAEKVGMDRVTVARTETGRIDVPYSTLVRLAAGLGVPLVKLVGDATGEPDQLSRPAGKRK